MRIYTKTGDTGETGLFDGTRVSKADPRVAAYGDVDELNAWIGVVRAWRADSATPGDDVDDVLARVQIDLFAIGAVLADPARRIAARVDKAVVGEADVERLERAIDVLEAELPPLRRFILPGGCLTGARLHFARTIARRAERTVAALGPAAVPPVVLAYLNRLSDLLFVMARAVNRRAGAPEAEW